MAQPPLLEKEGNGGATTLNSSPLEDFTSDSFDGGKLVPGQSTNP